MLCGHRTLSSWSFFPRQCYAFVRHDAATSLQRLWSQASQVAYVLIKLKVMRRALPRCEAWQPFRMNVGDCRCELVGVNEDTRKEVSGFEESMLCLQPTLQYQYRFLLAQWLLRRIPGTRLICPGLQTLHVFCRKLKVVQRSILFDAAVGFALWQDHEVLLQSPSK